MEKEFKIVPLGKEDGEKAIAKLQQFLEENNLELVAGPVITQHGTLGAEVKIFGKVELIPSKFMKDEEEGEATQAA